jgi:hypothetical protein
LDGSLLVNADTPAVGRDAITAVAQGFMNAFPDMQVIMDDLVINGDQTVPLDPQRHKRGPGAGPVSASTSAVMKNGVSALTV